MSEPLLAGEQVWFDWCERRDLDEPEPYCPPYLEYLRSNHPKYAEARETSP